MTRPGDGIHTELVEAAIQELAYLLSHKLTVSLPAAVLTGSRVRGRSPRQQMSMHRADTEGALRH